MTPNTTPDADAAQASSQPTPWLRLKAFVLLLALAALLVGTTAYILYARGVFEQTQRLVLFTDDAEGVSVA